jgi:V8-like Glu-specific endopeptidase
MSTSQVFSLAEPPAPSAEAPGPTAAETPGPIPEAGWPSAEAPWPGSGTPWSTSEIPGSTAEGPWTESGIPGPTAEGPWTESGIPAEGPWTAAEIPGWTAEGRWSESEVPWSTAGGPGSTAEGPGSTAEGLWPESEAPWSTAESPAAAAGPWSESEVPWAEAPAWVTEGPALEDEVIGPDERRLVTDTLAVPYRWVCSIDVTYPSGAVGRGSGVLIGPRHVLTAAHVIYAEHGATPRSVYVAPGRNGRTATSGVLEPVGRIKAVAYSVSSAFLSALRIGSRFDFALLTLDRDVSALPVRARGGQPLGHWGHPQLGAKTVLRALEPAFLTGKPVHVCGYPGDWCGRTHLDPKVGCSATDQGTAQLVHHGLATFPAPMPGLLLHTADTFGGQSGAPVWMEFTDGSRYLVGIHVDAHVVTDATTGRPLPITANKAVHLSADVLALVRSWIT